MTNKSFFFEAVAVLVARFIRAGILGIPLPWPSRWPIGVIYLVFGRPAQV